jgi:anti-sigma B factor antagonist
MAQPKVKMNVRAVNEWASVVDIQGEITSFAEDELMNAYDRADHGHAKAFILNFTGLDYMNSGGIGLLVTLLVRANRQQRRLLAYGLGDHYRRIFELTRLNEAISIYNSEAEALAAARPAGQAQ